MLSPVAQTCPRIRPGHCMLALMLRMVCNEGQVGPVGLPLHHPFSSHCLCIASPQNSLPSSSCGSASCQLSHSLESRARLHALLDRKKPSAALGCSVRGLSKHDVLYCLALVWKPVGSLAEHRLCLIIPKDILLPLKTLLKLG